MPQIAIISPSIRKGRNSHRVALYFMNYLRDNNVASTELLDLEQYNFPLFDERLKYQENPSEKMIDFAEKVRSADGVLIIAPEYNGGYPASLKNAIDLLTGEWRRKPIAIVTVSDGIFGGTQVIISLQFILWKLGALTVPSSFRLPEIVKAFNEDGVPFDKPGMDKRASSFINELLWLTEAKKRMTE